MNSMSNAVRQFAAHVGLEASWLRGAVSHAVDDLAIASKNLIRVLFQGSKDVAGRHACIGHITFEALISLPGVVINLPCAQASDQAMEVLQHVPVVLPYR